MCMPSAAAGGKGGKGADAAAAAAVAAAAAASSDTTGVRAALKFTNPVKVRVFCTNCSGVLELHLQPPNHSCPIH
jgi:hypothetical protein